MSKINIYVYIYVGIHMCLNIENKNKMHLLRPMDEECIKICGLQSFERLDELLKRGNKSEVSGPHLRLQEDVSSLRHGLLSSGGVEDLCDERLIAIFTSEIEEAISG